MANNQTTDVTALHAAILAQIAAQYPVFKTVDDYPVDKRVPVVPAFILENEDGEVTPPDDFWTGQTPIELRFCARVIMPTATDSIGRTVRALAYDIAAFIYQNKFGCPVGAAVPGMISEDNFEPALDQFTVWRVEFTMLANVGASAWDDWVTPKDTSDQLGAPDPDLTGTDPADLDTRYSFDPDIGAGHENDYQAAK